MQVAIEVLVRAALFVFASFDLIGILWARGLATSRIELVWWLASPAALLLGSLVSRSSGNRTAIISVAIVGAFGCASALTRLYQDWLVVGMSLEVSIWRVILTSLVVVMFAVAGIRARKNNQLVH